MRYLVQSAQLDPKRVGVAGYAHMKPLADNETPVGRARNRRVEFVFVQPDNVKDFESAKHGIDEMLRRRKARKGEPGQEASAAGLGVVETPAGAIEPDVDSAAVGKSKPPE